MKKVWSVLCYCAHKIFSTNFVKFDQYLNQNFSRIIPSYTIHFIPLLLFPNSCDSWLLLFKNYEIPNSRIQECSSIILLATSRTSWQQIIDNIQNV